MLNGLDKIDLTAPDAMEQINALAGGLISKNTELLSKVSTKDELTAAERSKLTALELSEANSQIEKAKAASDWAEADRLKDIAHNTRFEALTAENQTYKQGEEGRLITDGINAQFIELKVNPLHSAGYLGMFKAQSKVVDGQAMIGDKTQSEYIAAWALTDSGKAAIIAPENNGGDGLGGAGGAGQGKPLTLTERSIAANAIK
tara:strand:+ start:59 stop:667 length:609 start_codon:yes stop_codon:yes gene_type:complete